MAKQRREGRLEEVSPQNHTLSSTAYVAQQFCYHLPLWHVQQVLRVSEEVPAADLLEEAISKDPNLRQQYGSKLKLWRRGISM